MLSFKPNFSLSSFTFIKRLFSSSFTDASQATGTFTQEDGEYYLTNGDTKGFYSYKPIALQSGLVDDSKVIIEFDLKVVTASVNTHTIIGTYA